VKESRKIIWLKMAKINYNISLQSYTNPKLINNLEIDKNLKNSLKERDAMYNVSITSGKKPADISNKRKDALNEILPVDFNSNTDTTNKNFNELFEKVNKETNESDEGPNLYFKYTDLLCRVDLKYVMYHLINYNLGIAIANEKINLDALSSVLTDLETMSMKLLYPHSSFKIILYYLFSKIYKLQFIYDFCDFLLEKMAKISKKKNLEILTNKDVLIKFSNYYNERCSTTWTNLLNKSKEYLEKSLNLVKGEFYSFENGFSIHQLLLDLSDINLLIAEYRPNLLPKYSDINQIIAKVNSLTKMNKYYDRENDDLPYLRDEDLEEDLKNEKMNWLNDRDRNEKLICRNAIRNSLYYMDLAIKVVNVKKLLSDNIFELAANANLIDPSKLPKDIANQILENDYLNKKRNKMYLQSVTQKTACDASDVYNILKNFTKEIEFFTLLNEEAMKNISKLHKYLKANSTNYNNRCYIEITPCVEITDLNLEIVKKDQILVFWVFNGNEIINPNPNTTDPITDSINMVYVIGSNSLLTEYKDYVNGRISVSKFAIVKINRMLYELKINLRNCLTLSEPKKKRDIKYLQMDYVNLLTELCCEFLRAKST
jgi:hypothetical protein